MTMRWTVLLIVLVFGVPNSSFAARQSNIILILVDDLGWPHLGCYDSTGFYESPEIDRVAAQGCRFTDFYAAGAVCSPTRASIQSGQYQSRFGITDFIPGHPYPFARLNVPPVRGELPLEMVTPAEALKICGYVTGYFGKWHLGGREFEPDRQGYDASLVTSGRHFKFRTSPPVDVPEGTYLAEFLTDRTIDFIREYRERPFFVQLSHFAVHIPLEARPETIRHFEQKPRPVGFNDHSTYAAMVKHVDESVGRIVQVLEELDLAEETLLVITSDNGGLSRSAHGGQFVSSNSPLRNEKGSLYEGGIRVPLIVRWPGKVPAGSICPEPTISVDFWPTFLEVAQTEATPEIPHQPLDGVSLVPLLLDPTAKLERDALYFHYPHYHHSTPAGAIRSRDWKLIEFFETGKVELFNLLDDPEELHNLAMQDPQRAQVLREQLARWRSETGATMPTPNPQFDPDRARELIRDRRRQ